MQRINVLHITYDMGFGGTEQVIRNLITGSDARVLKHSLCCIESPLGPWGIELKEKGIQTFVFERTPKLNWKIIAQIRSIINQNDIHIVHAHQYTPFTYGFFATLGSKTKLIFTEHGRFYPDSSTLKRRIINRLLFPFVDKVTAISEATKQAMVKFEQIKAKKIQVIYNGIHAVPIPENIELQLLRQSIGLDEEHFIFGTIARFDPIKNQTLMIKAFAKVLEKHPHVRLVMVGDGEERARLEALVNELNLEGSVIFTGYQTMTNQYVYLFDVFLLTSLSEGTSMTLLEAMSAGKPCIVSNAGGNPEIVSHNLTGLVFANENEKELIQAMLFLTESRDLRLKFSTEAISVFDEQFTAERMQTEFLTLYNELAGGTKAV